MILKEYNLQIINSGRTYHINLPKDKPTVVINPVDYINIPSKKVL